MDEDEEEVDEVEASEESRFGSGIVGKIFLNPGEEGVFIVGVEGEVVEVVEKVEEEVAKLDVGVFEAGPWVGVSGDDGWTVSWGGSFRVCTRVSGAEVDSGMGLGNEGGKVSQSSAFSYSDSPSDSTDSESDDSPPSSCSLAAAPFAFDERTVPTPSV
jgi:hypothetical protein